MVHAYTRNVSRSFNIKVSLRIVVTRSTTKLSDSRESRFMRGIFSSPKERTPFFLENKCTVRGSPFKTLSISNSEMHLLKYSTLLVTCYSISGVLKDNKLTPYLEQFGADFSRFLDRDFTGQIPNFGRMHIRSESAWQC